MSTEAPERLGVVGLDVELPDQHCVDGFNLLSERIREAEHRIGELPLLISSGQVEQAEAIVLSEFGSDICTDVGLVADGVAVRVLCQKFASDSQVIDVSTGESEFEDETTCYCEKMQFLPEDHLFSGGDLAKICTICWPVSTRIWGRDGTEPQVWADYRSHSAGPEKAFSALASCGVYG